jgi:hypothetical protein
MYCAAPVSVWSTHAEALGRRGLCGRPTGRPYPSGVHTQRRWVAEGYAVVRQGARIRLEYTRRGVASQSGKRKGCRLRRMQS